MTISNPFSVLAIDADAVRKLSDANIFALVGSAYRTLSKIHHPDAGGNAEEFQQVSQAFNQLSASGTEWDYWKAKLLQPKRDKTQQYQELLGKQVAATEMACDRLLQVWSSIVDDRAFGRATHAVRNARLLMSDTMDLVLRSKSVHENRKDTQYCVIPKLTGQTYDLDIDSSGSLARSTLTKTVFDVAAESPRAHPSWVEVRTNRKKSYYWKRGVTEWLPDYKLLGCLDSDAMQPLNGVGLSFAGMLSGETCEEHYEWAKTGFPVSIFSAALPYLKPNIRALDYLIAGTVRDKELFFVVMGQVRKLVSHKKLKESGNY